MLTIICSRWGQMEWEVRDGRGAGSWSQPISADLWLTQVVQPLLVAFAKRVKFLVLIGQWIEWRDGVDSSCKIKNRTLREWEETPWNLNRRLEEFALSVDNVAYWEVHGCSVLRACLQTNR
jgi:hypothetical protein